VSSEQVHVSDNNGGPFSTSTQSAFTSALSACVQRCVFSVRVPIDRRVDYAGFYLGVVIWEPRAFVAVAGTAVVSGDGRQEKAEQEESG
jgi:hypothetical protein